MITTERTPNRPRTRRWLVIALVIMTTAVACVPWISRLPFFRSFLIARANAIFAPGSVEFSSVELSWFSNTKINDLVLRDAQGDTVVTSPLAEFRWNLFQILFARPGTATLRLMGGSVDIERLPNGTVDLYETLRPVIDEHPTRQLIIEIADARLRFRDPALAEPVTADRMNLMLDLAIEALPITWNINLSQDAHADRAASRLSISGSFLRHAQPLDDEVATVSLDQLRQRLGDVTLTLKADNWPVAVKARGIAVSGQWTGVVAGEHTPDRWVLKADSRMTDLLAHGDALGAEPRRHPSLSGRLEAAGDRHDWALTALDVSTPIELGLETQQDAASTPNTPRVKSSTLRVTTTAHYSSGQKRLTIGPITFDSPLAQLTGHGTIENIDSHPLITLAGSFAPNWQQFTQILSDRIEPGARVDGQSSQWRVFGTIPGMTANADLRDLQAEFGTRIDQLEVFGLRLSQATIQFRLKQGKLTCDPIDATLNDGTLHLVPIFTSEEQGGSWVTFDRNSLLRGVLINEEVSHRVLSFAAPVLDGATRVQGRVSVAPVDVAFPLAGTTGPARVVGDLLFDDVRFLPGPLAADLIQFFVRGAEPALVLRDPISVRIADRKVYQKGLKLPIAQLATIELEGSVDFDRRLDLLARLKLNRGANNNAPFLSSLIQLARLEIPIRGTLSDPRIDEDGFKQRMKSVGSDLIENSVQLGVEGLGQILKNIGKRRERNRGPR